MGFCFSGCFSIRGPVSVRAPEKGFVKVRCHYKRGWETHVKWWCRGSRWVSCEILIQTRGSEQEEKKDLVSIKDSHTDCTFTVTMEGLRQNDSNIYWCGIQRLGPDLGTQVQLTVDPGKNFLIYTTRPWSSGLGKSMLRHAPPQG